ncbi:hypothetical protein B879_03051 [Cecembia lonarensis LW9]|uniref:Uncharacterized protein n=1 Tax=Cecembia lonarensis (strain CCUG 58316 / KCTC 22772 / LW9) TaxID=1225176 RepID=K1KW12_CECL9|nr:hypothetical protein B879_03051 [Cecembia lonarensis LW9]
MKNQAQIIIDLSLTFLKNTLYRGFTRGLLFYIFEMGDSNNFLVSAFIVKCGGIVSAIVLYPHFFQVFGDQKMGINAL